MRDRDKQELEHVVIRRGVTGWLIYEDVPGFTGDRFGGFEIRQHARSTLEEAINLARELLTFSPTSPAQNSTAKGTEP